MGVVILALREKVRASIVLEGLRKKQDALARRVHETLEPLLRLETRECVWPGAPSPVSKPEFWVEIAFGSTLWLSLTVSRVEIWLPGLDSN